jgi:putative flavoprotein involved in K+ transport
MFQFPNYSIELPGRAYAGSDLDGFSHKDEVVKFLEDYCASIRAPLRTGVNVLSLCSTPQARRYEIETDHGILVARNVVIATGPHQKPRTSPFSAGLSAGVVQLYASQYRNPDTLPPGGVLVVGSGNSGCQIAEELLESGRRVFLAVGRHSRGPRRYRGRDAYWWRRALGLLDQTIDAVPEGKRQRAPLVTGVRGGHDVDIRRYASIGMTLLGHVRDIRAGRVAFSPDLEDILRDGDKTFAEFTLAADEYIRNSGMGVDFPPSEVTSDRSTVALRTIDQIDVHSEKIGTVLWATGYTLDFNWIKLPIFDERGTPIQRRGVTAIPGIFFLGLRWLYKQKSSFLYGVGEDAEYLAARIAGDKD